MGGEEVIGHRSSVISRRSTDDRFVKVAHLSELPDGSVLAVKVEGRDVCLANCEGEIYAFQDNCTHRDFPLSQGEVEGCAITCEWHGAMFDLRTGEALCLPAVKPIRTYACRVEDGAILVDVRQAG
jgi:3-phenylpropionate/trans-cinnamate dioxygenase ferredoxin subunit